ncbi:MAG: threonine--tRNA ligase, partial [Actinomycetota bacterium]|nr:threonine--tRNA ligase [Actinomycetota bacterium]
TKAKVPFMLLAGERDVTADAVSFRFRDGSQVNGVSVDAAVALITDWVHQRRNDSPSEDAIDTADRAGTADG